jgi:hypothetical protein
MIGKVTLGINDKFINPRFPLIPKLMGSEHDQRGTPLTSIFHEAVGQESLAIIDQHESLPVVR